MGLDALDIAFRIEKAFDIKMEREEVQRRLYDPAFKRSPDYPDYTAGDIYEYVCTKLREANRPVPHSSWHRVQKALAESLRKSPKVIRPGTVLRKDLGHD